MAIKDESSNLARCEANPRLVIVLSGKRKSGKDYIASLMSEHIGDRVDLVAILRIAEPIKREFAKTHRLEFSELLGSSGYKESYREAMVEWSEAERARNGWNCFLEQAIKEQESFRKPVWILTDARRNCDIEYFDSEQFRCTNVIKLRIEASESVRAARGWLFTNGIDDKTTECGLDQYSNWTYVIQNNGHNDKLNKSLAPILSQLDAALGS